MSRRTRFAATILCLPTIIPAFGLIILLLATGAQATTLSVPGTANIFGAGHSGLAATPEPAGDGGGTAPPFIVLDGGSAVTFSSITGVVDVGCLGCSGGPDSDLVPSSDLQSYNGISGMFSDRRAPLYGVFVGAIEPADPAPDRLHFEANTEFAALSPQLNQVFFIGDGLTGTGSGSVQQFMVPVGAERLYLGIADGLASGGLPGGYFNNSGEFEVNSSVVDVAQGPATSFALDPVRPNPARGGTLSVSFSLAVPGPASIELLDLAGRRVAAREAGALGAGRQTLEFDLGRRLAPGLYLVRLRQGAEARVARVALLD